MFGDSPGIVLHNKRNSAYAVPVVIKSIFLPHNVFRVKYGSVLAYMGVIFFVVVFISDFTGTHKTSAYAATHVFFQ